MTERLHTIKYEQGFTLKTKCPNGIKCMVGSLACEKCANFVENNYDKQEVLCRSIPPEIKEAEKAYPWDEGEGGDEDWLNEEKKKIEKLRKAFIKGWDAHKEYINEK